MHFYKSGHRIYGLCPGAEKFFEALTVFGRASYIVDSHKVFVHIVVYLNCLQNYPGRGLVIFTNGNDLLRFREFFVGWYGSYLLSVRDLLQ
jgi:hypothetical protein